MNDLELQSYYISLYLDSVFFCDDSIVRIKDNIEAITSKETLEIFYNYLEEIESELCYPKEIINSIGEVINYIKPYINEESILSYSKVENKYNEIKDLEFNDGKYLYEAILKNFDISSVFDERFNKEVIRNSVIFDYYAFTALLSDEVEIDNNYFYIMSLKKLMLVYPEIFLDININRRALNILEANKEYEESERLIYKMNNIEKFQENNFNYSSFVSLIDYIVVESMLLNSKNIKDNKSLLTYSSLNTISELIDKECIDNEKMKKNMYNILSQYKEIYIDEASISKDYRAKLLEKYNNCIGKLNSLKEYNQDTVMGEFILRSDFIDKVRIMFKPYNLDELCKQDIEYIKYLINSSEIENKDTFYLTINKCLELLPSMFDNKIIYEKTISLLDKNTIHNNITKRKVNKIYRG